MLMKRHTNGYNRIMTFDSSHTCIIIIQRIVGRTEDAGLLFGVIGLLLVELKETIQQCGKQGKYTIQEFFFSLSLHESHIHRIREQQKVSEVGFNFLRETLHIILAEKEHTSSSSHTEDFHADSDVQSIIGYLRRSKEIAELKFHC